LSEFLLDAGDGGIEFYSLDFDQKIAFVDADGNEFILRLIAD
jgi:hypothetical protein